MDISNIIGIIQIALAVIACVLAWFIPKRIMWEQKYSSLSDDYRSYDFAVAVQNIIEFFVITCKSDIENIPKEYEKCFFKDLYDIDVNEYAGLSSETILKSLQNKKSLEINGKIL